MPFLYEWTINVTWIHVIEEVFVLVKPHLSESGRIYDCGVQLGPETAGDAMRTRAAINVTDLKMCGKNVKKYMHLLYNFKNAHKKFVQYKVRVFHTDLILLSGISVSFEEDEVNQVDIFVNNYIAILMRSQFY